jgi:hypothetical protein
VKRVRAAAALMERLRAAEATVSEDLYTLLKQPFLFVSGHLLSVNGERVEVYEYASVAAAAAAAKNISADVCLVKTPQDFMMMDWSGPPPVYKSGRVIVQYAGLNSGVITLLVKTLGPQFAGVSSRAGLEEDSTP